MIESRMPPYICPCILQNVTCKTVHLQNSTSVKADIADPYFALSLRLVQGSISDLGIITFETLTHSTVCKPKAKI